MLYDKGLYCIPISTEKKPAFKGWTDKLLTKEEMINYLVKDPSFNIGVVTGQRVNLIVLDFDGDDGELDYKRFILDRNINTYSIKTPHGYHCYFRTDNEYTGACKQLSYGIDIRSYHNQILSIGSINSHGQEYTEINNEAIIDLPIELEKMLKRFIREPDPKETKTVRRTKNLTKRSYRNMAYLDSWIKSNGTIKEGQRNNTLFERSLFCRSAGWSKSEVLSHIKNANKELCSTPLKDDEVKEIVNSCFKMKLFEKKATHNKRTPNIGVPGHLWDWLETLDPKDKLKARSLYLELEFITTWHGTEFDEIAHYNKFFGERLDMDRRTIKPILDLFKKHKLISIRKERLKHGKNFDTSFLIFHPENFKG